MLLTLNPTTSTLERATPQVTTLAGILGLCYSAWAHGLLG